MRLEVLNRGYGPGTKLLFALIRLLSPEGFEAGARYLLKRGYR